jgi:hypothetical protein
MNLIWKAEDPNPLPKAAVEIGVRALAGRAGLEVPDEATVVLESTFLIGSYPLCQAIARDGTTCWFVDYDVVRIALLEIVDAELKAAGVDLEAEGEERDVYRVLRRRFIHWPAEQVKELRDVVYSLRHLLFHDENLDNLSLD